MAGVALITGGAQRIGSEIARHLHAAGFTIALHYRSSAEQAQSLAAELCGERPDSCQLFQADLEFLPSVRQLAADVLAHYGSLAALVNNASGFNPTPIEHCTEAQFDSMLGSNLKGPYFLIQAVLPGLRQSSGCIVNILDVHVQRPLRHFNAYGAAKAGLASLTRSLALELGPAIRVNGVAPGAILWPEGDEAYDEEARQKTVAGTPLKRMGEPADIARTVKFLACDAPFITGTVITVDGGRSLGN
jgi:pteridine reductase